MGPHKGNKLKAQFEVMAGYTYNMDEDTFDSYIKCRVTEALAAEIADHVELAVTKEPCSFTGKEAYGPTEHYEAIIHVFSEKEFAEFKKDLVRSTLLELACNRALVGHKLGLPN